MTQTVSGLESQILLTSALRAGCPEKLEERARVSRNVSGYPRTHRLRGAPPWWPSLLGFCSQSVDIKVHQGSLLGGLLPGD